LTSTVALDGIRETLQELRMILGGLPWADGAPCSAAAAAHLVAAGARLDLVTIDGQTPSAAAARASARAAGSSFKNCRRYRC
jgi:hypothetical protein